MSTNYIYFFAVFLTLQISRAATSKKHIYFQIDEFIKQLMTSEKFDELADVIADKAAQKIRNMDSKTTSPNVKNKVHIPDNVDNDEPKSNEKVSLDQEQTNSKDSRSNEKIHYSHDKNKHEESWAVDKKYSDRNHERSVSKDSKPDFEKSNYLRERYKERDSKSREKSSYGQEKKKDKSSRSSEKTGRSRKNPASHSQKRIENIDKIGTERFLQNQLASKELVLNYKHLKDKLEKHRFDIKGNNIKPHKDYDKNKRNNRENYRTIEKQGVKNEKTENTHKISKLKQIDSKELLLSFASDENKAHEQTTFHDIEDNIKYIQNSGENKSTNDSDAGNEEKEKKGVKQDFDFNEKYNSDRDFENAKAFIDQVMDKVSRELNNSSYSSKEVLLVGLDRAHADEPKYKNSFARKSGGSIYANEINSHINVVAQEPHNLQTSAEEAEYHENSDISTQPKFINTYK